MADQFKIERRTAKRLFTMSINQLTKAISAHKPVETVQSKYDTFKQRTNDVQEKHAAYLSNMHVDDSDPTEEEAAWLDSVETQADLMDNAFSQFIQANSTPAKIALAAPTSSAARSTESQNQSSDGKKASRRACHYEATTLEATLNSLKISVGDDAALDTIKDAQSDVKSQLERYRLAQRDYVMLLSDEEEVSKETTCMQQMQALCAKEHVNAGRTIEKRTSSSKLEAAERKPAGLQLKLERMKLPTFDGEIRDYPRFKADFQKHVSPMIKSNESETYILKSCLSKEPLEAVKNVDDDLSAMWDRLESKYGRSSILIAEIMKEIKKLSPVKDGDNQSFIKLVNTIEGCYRDLVRIKKESEICNSTIVSLVEEKLPATICNMWSLEVSDQDTKINDANLFPSLLEFLLKHRRAIEYRSSDLRVAKVSFAAESVVHLAEDKREESKKSVATALPPSSATEERKGGCWLHASNLHDITTCRTFLDMTTEARWDAADDYRVCWCCLKSGHRQAYCYKLRECGKDGCREHHHTLLHIGKKKKEHPASHVTQPADKGPCLLQIMNVPAGRDGLSHVNVLWDSGATVSMITFSKARSLGLSGVNARITIVKIGGVRETIESKIYDVPLCDKEGNIDVFHAYGISQISSSIEAIEIAELAVEFEVNPSQVTRPSGEIDMLIGFEYAGFHPEREKSKGHLVLMKNKFGRCVSGAHPLLEEKTQMLVQKIKKINKVRIEDFYSNESLGVSCTPKCGNCRCGTCPIGGKQYTIQQERELAMIECGLHLEDNQWTATYPWSRDPHDLPNNYSAALATLKSTENRLKKNEPHMKIYEEQIQDMIQRGVAVKIETEEQRRYQGPVFYLSHHEVLKPDSISTPCRIVFNSSAKYANHVLNDYWVKGPDMMNNLLGVLLRFRENTVAVAGDIKKMYHTVNISEVDQHTHRFLWRDMEQNKKPDIYKLTTVSFGDKPAGTIASLALRKTAELGAQEFPTAAATISENSYVDDILSSFEDDDEAKAVTTEIDLVLSKGSFVIKEWITSTSSSSITSAKQICEGSKDTDSEVSKVLGVVWNPQKDTFEYNVKVNFSPKSRKIRSESNLTSDNILQNFPMVLTQRIILSQLNSFYDPIGLAAPFIVCAKIMMRRIHAYKLGWDDPVPDQDRNNWMGFFKSLFEMEKLQFTRSTKAPGAIGKPTLIVFSDASEDAIGACAYVRWETDRGDYVSRLLVAKSRLAPLRKTTIPRLELNAALMGTRLGDFIKTETRMQFAKTFYIVDSEIVRAQIQKESYGFNTFVGVRVGEIQSKTNREEWYWIEGSKNIADIITRGKPACDIGPYSEWQCGPAFLQEKEEIWPLKQSFSGGSLPDVIIPHSVLAVAREENGAFISSIVESSRFSSYYRLMRVTARIMAIFQSPASLKYIGDIPNRSAIRKAERVWVVDAQQNIHDHVNPQTMKRLGMTSVDGILVVGSRIENWEDHTYSNGPPILLSSKNAIAKLYAQYVHDRCHLGVSSVASKVRTKYWIVGLRRLLASIAFRCVPCKIANEKLQQQAMGQLPVERTKPTPAWSYVSLDLFGPYAIKGETNKRSRSKGYAVIFNCLLCRAVHIDISTDYSTASFLLVLRRFMSIRGKPIKIWSDRGSQLRAADKELKEIVAGLNEKELIEFGGNNSFEWEFTSPSAPWQNGCSEALIKSVKRSLKISIGSQVFSFSEMQTILFETASLVNERPIGRHPTSVEDGAYLSPNDLLLGNSTNRMPDGSYDNASSRYARYRFVQQVINSFWKRWTRDYFPTLLVQQKWHTSHRNVRVGDVVLIQDSNLIRGKWKLGQVIRADPSLRDGYVRNVDIHHKNPGSKNFLTLTRPIQKIIVLVPVEDQ